MAALRAGGADVLVATTVIEVGIDIPNATRDAVDAPSASGLPATPVRGRVGAAPGSLCLLFGPRSRRACGAARPARRLRLAEIDLELRGEGELAGTRQSGLARFRFAQLPEDAEVLERAHAAPRPLDDDPRLEAPEHALLAARSRRSTAAAVAAA